MSTADAHRGKITLLSRMSHFLIVFAYLWLLLSVYTLHNSVILPDWGLAAHLGSATLKALVFAKFVLIGEHLKLGSRAEHLPLIWVVLIKSALFAILLIGFDLAEERLVGMIRPHTGEAGDDGLQLTGISTTLSLAVMAFVSLIPFFGIGELSKAVGEARMRELFFRKRQPPAAPLGGTPPIG